MQRKDVTMWINPGGGPSEQWTFSALVLGDWAVHQAHPGWEDAPADYDWHLSHIPTGILACVSDDMSQLEKAAVCLDAIEPPDVVLTVTDTEATLQPVSLEWVRLMSAALRDLDLMVYAPSGMLKPSELYERVAERRGQIVFD